MQTKEYTQLLTDKDKLRIAFTKNRGKILKFVVQYYSLTGSPLAQDNNSAFTESKEYIIKNYQRIKENFIFARK